MGETLVSWFRRVFAPVDLATEQRCARCDAEVPPFAGVRYREQTFCSGECDADAQADAI